MRSRNTFRERSHISFFWGGDPFCEVVQLPENTHGELTGLPEWSAGLSLRLSHQRTSPFRLSDQQVSTFSPKLQTLYCLFKSHGEVWTYSSPHVLAGYRNLHTSGYFPVICWSYLGTEISVTLSIGDKLYSCHHLFFFSFLWDHFVDVILRPHWICLVHPRQLS